MAEVGLAAAERGPDRFAEALVRMDLGIALADLAHEWSDDNREALCHLRRSRSDLHALGMPRAVITCLINMCDVLEAAGDFHGGIACAEECLAMCRDLGGLPPAEAATNINLGNLYGKVGDHDKQLACYHAAVRITDEIDYDIGRAYALRGIGEVLLTTGELDDAVSFLQDSIALYRTIGDPSAEAAALELLGRVHLARDEPAAATDALDDALALARNYDDRARQASVLAHLGAARALCPPVERVPEL
jgi:tetratricopeptide (TPR) repeat protein